MTEMKIKHQISTLMQEVQNATDSDKNVFDEGYIDDVNNRIGDIEKAIQGLKNELAKHHLNDW